MEAPEGPLCCYPQSVEGGGFHKVQTDKLIFLPEKTLHVSLINVVVYFNMSDCGVDSFHNFLTGFAVNLSSCL